ncbi:cobalamin biosynthesis protein [Beijerinckia mobilis]|uniref:cobalamin biosynthesis protein n=1 Tax=Beijerinckia mobilis TaxID=231434 RepID=UPI001FD87B74|nr:cobalamin biosynthesis protein [Beijerinckia mobilis]
MADGMIAIGIGCRIGCPAEDIAALVRACLIGENRKPIGLFTIAEKAGEAGLIEAAQRLGLPLTFLDPAQLAEVAPKAITRSARVEALYGLPSIAETAALAGIGLAGAGLDAHLLGPRIAEGGATCALAAAANATQANSFPAESQS